MNGIGVVNIALSQRCISDVFSSIGSAVCPTLNAVWWFELLVCWVVVRREKYADFFTGSYLRGPYASAYNGDG